MTIDNYVINTTKYLNSNVSGGEQIKAITQVFTLTTENQANAILRFATLPSMAQLLRITIGCDAITGCSSVAVGIYEKDFGNVLDSELLATDLDFTTANKTLDGLENITIANSNKSIEDLYETLHPDTVLNENYVDLALTLGSTPSAEGNVSIKIEYTI